MLNFLLCFSYFSYIVFVSYSYIIISYPVLSGLFASDRTKFTSNFWWTLQEILWYHSHWANSYLVTKSSFRLSAVPKRNITIKDNTLGKYAKCRTPFNHTTWCNLIIGIRICQEVSFNGFEHSHCLFFSSLDFPLPWSQCHQRYW